MRLKNPVRELAPFRGGEGSDHGLLINKKSPDIADGVHVCKNDLDVGVDDQSVMFEYATNQTEDAMPITHSMATSLGEKSTDVRMSDLETVVRGTTKNIGLDSFIDERVITDKMRCGRVSNRKEMTGSTAKLKGVVKPVMMDVRSKVGGDDDIHGGVPDGAGGHGRDASTQQPHRSQHDQEEQEQEREKKETGKETKKEKRKGC